MFLNDLMWLGYSTHCSHQKLKDTKVWVASKQDQLTLGGNYRGQGHEHAGPIGIRNGRSDHGLPFGNSQTVTLYSKADNVIAIS